MIATFLNGKISVEMTQAEAKKLQCVLRDYINEDLSLLSQDEEIVFLEEQLKVILIDFKIPQHIQVVRNGKTS